MYHGQERHFRSYVVSNVCADQYVSYLYARWNTVSMMWYLMLGLVSYLVLWAQSTTEDYIRAVNVRANVSVYEHLWHGQKKKKKKLRINRVQCQNVRKSPVFKSCYLRLRMVTSVRCPCSSRLSHCPSLWLDTVQQAVAEVDSRAASLQSDSRIDSYRKRRGHRQDSTRHRLLQTTANRPARRGQNR